MTSRGIKFSSNQDEEKSRLLDNDPYEDDFEVSFLNLKVTTVFLMKFVKIIE